MSVANPPTLVVTKTSVKEEPFWQLKIRTNTEFVSAKMIPFSLNSLQLKTINNKSDFNSLN